MPHPLLDTDICECPHKGRVILQSSTKDAFEVENAGVITMSDLKNASIVGCTNNIAGVPNPCASIVNIPDSALSSLLQIQDEKIILAESISSITTDKGFPLILQGSPKATNIIEIE